MRSIVTKRSSGRRCEHERWRGNELNTELGARYSTRWPRSGCPIRTAPGDSATGIREVSDLLRAVQQRRNTTEWPDTDIVICSAQRRPGHQPRRHVEAHRHDQRARLRSTKAGASTPATHSSARPAGTHPSTSTTPATLTSAQLDEGRGINPGDTNFRRNRTGRPSTEALNVALAQGRGINPGDTRADARRDNPGDTAQTRITATAFYDAQRRPGHQPRRHLPDVPDRPRVFVDRSTKAGASTPATHRTLR